MVGTDGDPVTLPAAESYPIGTWLCILNVGATNCVTVWNGPVAAKCGNISRLRRCPPAYASSNGTPSDTVG